MVLFVMFFMLVETTLSLTTLCSVSFSSEKVDALEDRLYEIENDEFDVEYSRLYAMVNKRFIKAKKELATVELKISEIAQKMKIFKDGEEGEITTSISPTSWQPSQESDEERTNDHDGDVFSAAEDE